MHDLYYRSDKDLVNKRIFPNNKSNLFVICRSVDTSFAEGKQLLLPSFCTPIDCDTTPVSAMLANLKEESSKRMEWLITEMDLPLSTTNSVLPARVASPYN